MGRMRYDKCIELLKKFTSGTSVNTDTLRREIMLNIGGSEITITGTMRFMRDMKMITDIGNCRWEIR